MGKKSCTWVIEKLELTWERGKNSSWAASWAWSWTWEVQKGRNEQWSLVVLLLTPFNILTLIFSKNVGSMQGQFLKKIDLNKFSSIYGTFSRSKPKKDGEFFNQRFLQCPGSPTFV